MDRLHRPSVIKYLRGFIRRVAFDKESLEKITAKTLVICGEYSRLKEDTIKFQKMMPRRYTTFVLKDKTGFLMTESHPQELCSSVNLFVETLGLTNTTLKFKYGTLP